MLRTTCTVWAGLVVQVVVCPFRVDAQKSSGSRLDTHFIHYAENNANAPAALGEFQRSLHDFNQSLEQKPRDAKDFFKRGSEFLQRGQYQRAIRDLDEAIRLNPDYADAFGERCWARAVMDRELETALSDCNMSLQLQPQNANVLQSRGFVYFRIGNYQAAVADENAAVSRDPKDAETYYVRGLAKLKAGDTVGGSADIAQAIRIDENVSETYAAYDVKP